MYKNIPMQPEGSVCVEHKLQSIYGHSCIFASVINTSDRGIFIKSHRCKKKRKAISLSKF